MQSESVFGRVERARLVGLAQERSPQFVPSTMSPNAGAAGRFRCSLGWFVERAVAVHQFLQ